MRITDPDSLLEAERSCEPLDGRPHISYEAEALGLRELNRLLAGWLDALLPVPLAEVREREQAEREALRALLNGGSS